MHQEQFARAKRILAGALEHPPQERAAYIDDSCGDDENLRAEVDSLLAHNVHTPTLLRTGGLGAADWDHLLQHLAPEDTESAGSRIGPYEIVGTLGEGGMGTVYHGRQVEPVRRDVAIKLIRRGLDIGRVVDRFEAERRTLALLDHSGIARMLDAGADHDGRPYFVMELVRGVPITEYADARCLGIDDRLELFLQVCHAVQHAHQKGVLHRDLKPSNILVTEQDGVPVPKVIDFGVAKAMAPDLDAGTLMTELGQFVGTPAYMSPEQAGAVAGGADTRSDVYSLGALLFELVTGRRPLRLHGLPLPEMQRIIATENPMKPSDAVVASQEDEVATADWAAAVAEARATSTSRLGRSLAGDLDNIVLKALRKEPERRYSSPERLAADIRRYLGGLPVHARADTFSYRAGKFVRRNRVGVAVAAAAIIALVGFAASMAYQRNLALAAEQRAQDEAVTAIETSDFLVGLFRQADPFVNQGNELTARELLDQGTDRIVDELADQPAVLASLLTTMSEAYTGIRAPDRAIELAGQSLELTRELYGEPHPKVADSMLALAAASAAASQSETALGLYREALAMREGLFAPGHPDIIEAKRLLGLELNVRAEFEESEALYREVLAHHLATKDESDPAVVASYQRLGVILHAQGEIEEATEYLQLALDRARAGEVGPLVTADILAELAVVMKNRSRLEEAGPMYRESLELREATLGDHPLTAQSHNNYGVYLRDVGEQEQALHHSQRALEVYKASLGENHLDVAIAYTNLASSLKRLGRDEEAEANYRASLASLENTMGRDFWVYGQVEYNYGVLFRDQQRYVEAEELMLRGYENVRDALGAESNRVQTIVRGIVELYDMWGKPEQAATFRALLPPGDGQ